MFKRLTIVPFEVCIAALLVISGAVGLLRLGVTDPVANELPYWENAILNVAAVLSGVWLAIGIAKPIARIEQAGLWLLNGVIVSRFILYGHYFGFKATFFITGVFDVAVVAASLIRMSTIRKRHVIIRLQDYHDRG